jgi:hypothetical protein
MEDPQDAATSANNVGAVYVFHWEYIPIDAMEGWVETKFLKPFNIRYGGNFGSGLAISGNTLAVGSSLEDSNYTGVFNGDPASLVLDFQGTGDLGAVHVFVKAEASETWDFQAYIKTSNAEGRDNFGAGFDLEGDFLVVGAPKEDSTTDKGVQGDQEADPSSSTNAGAAYFFARENGQWTQKAYIKSTLPQPDDEFGSSIALFGTQLAIGVPGEDSFSTNYLPAPTPGASLDQSGAVYVRQLQGPAN